MNSLIAIAGIICGMIARSFINKEKSISFYRALAWLFLCIGVVVMSSYFFRFFTAGRWLEINEVIRIGDSIWFFLLGLGFVPVAVNIRFPSGEMEKVVDLLKWSAVIRIAGFFLFVTLGKYRHLDEMIAFFNASGYSEIFLYVVSILECLGALGLIFHFYFRTGIYAAIGLLLLMMGAFITHVRNGDPFTDSADAFRQMTGLIFLILVFYSKKVARQKLT